ncbi:hypothetical protein ACM16X_02780 [Haloarcula japonica]|uniref:hypothetical protein n=1 Tax=Haloarcula japonica TaxID=29282 RepID=UPI0039F6EB89
MELNLKSKTFAIPATLIVAAVMITGAFMFSQGSIVNSADDITFVQVTDGAYSYDTMRGTFDDSYSGVHSDTARIGEYRISFDPQESGAAYGSHDTDSCFAVPKVTRNGEAVDDYNLQDNKIIIYSSWADRSGSDNRVQQYGDLEAMFANAFYMENAVYRGTYYGVQTCYGPFNQYNLDVDFDAVSMTAEAPKNVSEGEPVEVDVRFENQWRPLRADIQGEACTSDSLCEEFSREGVEIPEGGRTVTVDAIQPAENFTGDISVDVGGRIGLDTEEFTVEGVAVDCDSDGDYEDPSTCSMIQFGELESGKVVNVLTEPEEPPKPDSNLEEFFSSLLSSLWEILSYG